MARAKVPFRIDDVLKSGFVDDYSLERGRREVEAVYSDFLFLSRIHRLYDDEKPIGVAAVVFDGSSFLVLDDAL